MLYNSSKITKCIQTDLGKQKSIFFDEETNCKGKLADKYGLISILTFFIRPCFLKKTFRERVLLLTLKLYNVLRD